MSDRNLFGSVVMAAALVLTGSMGFPSEGWAQLEELVVTARKKEENLQHVSLAITAIGSETIVRQGVTNLQDVASFDPSFVFLEAGAQKSTRIIVRGLSPTRGRSNVAMLIDGIDVSSEAIGTSGASLLTSQHLLADVQRIEMVKGPQSALYGRSAFNGAILFVTKDAPEEFEGKVSAQIAEYGEYNLNAYVGGPVTDNLGLLVSGFYWDEEGQYTNSISGDDIGGGDGWGGSATINWDPAEVFSLKGRLEYSDEDYDQRPQARFLPDTIFTAADLPAGTAASVIARSIAEGGGSFLSNYGDADGAVVTPSESILTGDDHPGNTLELFRASLVASWDVNALRGTLTSYTGYLDSAVTEDYAYDGAAVGRPDTLFGNHSIVNDTDTEIFNQEIRYQSNLDGPVQFAVGGLYWTSERTQISSGILGNGCDLLSILFDGECDSRAPFVPWQDVFQRQIDAGNLQRQQPMIVDDDHWSVYALIEWEITDKWKLSLENRYVDEEQTVDRGVLTGTDDLTAEPVDLLEACTLFSADDPDDFCNTVATGKTIGISALSARGITIDGTGRRSDTVTSSYNTPKGTLEFSPNEALLFFISAGKGQKPGGIDIIAGGSNVVDLSVSAFEPEEMWAYELGTKTNWSGGFGYLQVNGSAFFQDYSDKQVSVRLRQLDGSTRRATENAASAEVWGVELDTVWQTPVEGLSLSVAYTWLDTEFIEFTDITDSPDTIFRVENCTPDPGDDGMLGTADDECVVSYAGKSLEGAPEHALRAAASLSRPFPNASMNWFIEGDTQYLSERFVDPDNAQLLDDFWILNLRVGLEADNWEAIVFVDNATDNDTIQSANGIPDAARILHPAVGFFSTDAGVLPNKRQVGFRAKYRF